MNNKNFVCSYCGYAALKYRTDAFRNKYCLKCAEHLYETNDWEGEYFRTKYEQET